MSSLAGTHSLQRLILTVGGRRIRGGAENDLVSVVYDENTYTKTYGSTGRVTRSTTNAKGGVITISLMQTDIEDIAFLDALANAPAPLDIAPIVIQDLNTGETIVAEQCWLQKTPDHNWNRDAGPREYAFDAANITKKPLIA